MNIPTQKHREIAEKLFKIACQAAISGMYATTPSFVIQASELLSNAFPEPQPEREGKCYYSNTLSFPERIKKLQAQLISFIEERDMARAALTMIKEELSDANANCDALADVLLLARYILPEKGAEGTKYMIKEVLASHNEKKGKK